MHTGFKTYTNTILYLTRSLTHSIFFFKLHKTTTTTEYRWEKNLSLHSYLFVLYHAQFNVHTLSYLSSCIDSAGSNFDVFFLLNAVFFLSKLRFKRFTHFGFPHNQACFSLVSPKFLWRRWYFFSIHTLNLCVVFFLLFCLLLFLFSSFRLLASFHSHSR